MTNTANVLRVLTTEPQTVKDIRTRLAEQGTPLWTYEALRSVQHLRKRGLVVSERPGKLTLWRKA